jgi:hypothetical protein
MLSPQKLAANRRNAQKSTGPRSAEGKSRARFNALKHGATAQIPVLPGEDPAAFQARVDAYKADLMPRSTLECDLVERMALMSTQFDRATRADLARITTNVLTSPVVAAHELELEVESLGRRLFFDRRGPLATYPNKTYFSGQPRTSWSGIPDDPDDPARLVKQLEAVSPGCCWLLDRWAELRARLEPGKYWHSPDKLKAVRLLGRQPLDAADVPQVAEIFLACSILDPQPQHPFSELQADLDKIDFAHLDERLIAQNLPAMRPPDPAAARAVLLALVDRAMDRLRALAQAHRVRDDAVAVQRLDVRAHDDSPQGERLRRYATACDRGLHRALVSIFKLRKEAESSEPELHLLTDVSDLPATTALYQPLVTDLTVDDDQAHQNEPTMGDEPNLQNEATSDVQQVPQNEATSDGRQNLQNEATDADGYDVLNEARIDDGDIHTKRRRQSLDDSPAESTTNWRQFAARRVAVVEKNGRNSKKRNHERGRRKPVLTKSLIPDDFLRLDPFHSLDLAEDGHLDEQLSLLAVRT